MKRGCDAELFRKVISILGETGSLPKEYSNQWRAQRRLRTGGVPPKKRQGITCVHMPYIDTHSNSVTSKTTTQTKQ